MVLVVKNCLPMQETQETCFDPWLRKVPWSRKWQPSPGFLPGEFHGQRSLVGCSPWGFIESDMTQHTYMPYIQAWSLCTSLFYPHSREMVPTLSLKKPRLRKVKLPAQVHRARSDSVRIQMLAGWLQTPCFPPLLRSDCIFPSLALTLTN